MAINFNVVTHGASARKNCGAHLVKFIIKDNPVYVIIDDLFHFCNNDYAYGRCSDPKEILC